MTAINLQGRKHHKEEKSVRKLETYSKDLIASLRSWPRLLRRCPLLKAT